MLRGSYKGMRVDTIDVNACPLKEVQQSHAVIVESTMASRSRQIAVCRNKTDADAIAEACDHMYKSGKWSQFS